MANTKNVSDLPGPVFKIPEDQEQWVEIESILPTKIYEDIMTELYVIAEKQIEQGDTTAPMRPQYQNMIDKSYSDFFERKDEAGGPTQTSDCGRVRGVRQHPKPRCLTPHPDNQIKKGGYTTHIKFHQRKPKTRE